MLGLKNKATRAKIQYALRVVLHHSSFNLCAELGKFLKGIFSKSLAVSNFTLRKTKCMCLIKFGRAPG